MLTVNNLSPAVFNHQLQEIAAELQKFTIDNPDNRTVSLKKIEMPGKFNYVKVQSDEYTLVCIVTKKNRINKINKEGK